MKNTYLTLILCIFYSACYWKPFPDEKYVFDKKFRDLVDCYKIGDTMIFKSSTNIIDSFVITNIRVYIN